jgi:hypothetical protein
MTYFQLLPQDLLNKVYEYDNTYREIFKNEISIEIWEKSFEFWLRYHHRIDSRQNSLLPIIMPIMFNRLYFDNVLKIRKKPKIENSFNIVSSKKDKYYYRLRDIRPYPSDIKFNISDKCIFVEIGYECFEGEIFNDKKKAIAEQKQYYESFPTGRVHSDGTVFVIERRDW